MIVDDVGADHRPDKAEIRGLFCGEAVVRS
jgi:hypothetical protein